MYLTETYPSIVRRTWRERFFSLPWRPWLATKTEINTRQIWVEPKPWCGTKPISPIAGQRVTPFPSKLTVQGSTPRRIDDDEYMPTVVPDLTPFVWNDTPTEVRVDTMKSGEGGDFGGGGASGSWSDDSQSTSSSPPSDNSD